MNYRLVWFEHIYFHNSNEMGLGTSSKTEHPQYTLDKQI